MNMAGGERYVQSESLKSFGLSHWQVSNPRLRCRLPRGPWKAPTSENEMPSYIPEYVYGHIPGTYGQCGLVSWPAHLRPREPHPDAALSNFIDKAKQAVPEASPALVNADGVFFLTFSADDRAGIATTIERLINMLDDMDGDENLEIGEDEEPYLGWPNAGQPARLQMCDDRELDDCGDEHGGDDEFTLGWSEANSLTGHLSAGAYGLHDGEMEPSLGWTEEADQERRQERAEGWLPEDGEPLLGWCENAGKGMTEAEPADERDGLVFNGDGQDQASELLRAVKPRRKPNQTYGEIAHELPDGTIMRTFVASTDSRALSRA
jgi:hypothetical protein